VPKGIAATLNSIAAGNRRAFLFCNVARVFRSSTPAGIRFVAGGSMPLIGPSTGLLPVDPLNRNMAK
jgi:hypothetical protein